MPPYQALQTDKASCHVFCIRKSHARSPLPLSSVVSIVTNRWLVTAVVLSILASADAGANCRGEIEGDTSNQIGTVVLFSSRGSGPKHPLYGAEFWAITGPYDTGLLRSYPVEFSPHLMQVVDLWDWVNAAATPLIVDVRVDGILRGEYVWLLVKEILSTDDRYNDAIAKYPNARRGTCGSLFRAR